MLFPLPGPCSPDLLAQLQSRQREYKLAALHAKQQGDTATAARRFRVAKVRPDRWEKTRRFRLCVVAKNGSAVVTRTPV